MRRSPFFKQAELVLRVLPHVHNEDRFAIKGGTALNFFVLNMPQGGSAYKDRTQRSNTGQCFPM